MHYPKVMRKAQAEVDRVVGRDRLPSFADKPHLPYFRALVKEVLRWRPPGPMGEQTLFTTNNGSHSGVS